MSEQGQRPIFFDESRRRWSVVSYFLIVAGVVGVIASLLFAVQIFLSPKLPDISLAARLGLAPSLVPEKPKTLTARGPAAVSAAVRARLRFVLGRNQSVQEAKRRLSAAIAAEKTPKAAPAPLPAGPSAPAVRAAFFEGDDKPALDSLTQHVGQITHLMPVWLLLNADGGGIEDIGVFVKATDEVAASNDEVARNEARAHGVAILPLIQNFDNSPERGGRPEVPP